VRKRRVYFACRPFNNFFNSALFARLTLGKEPLAPSTRKLPNVPADTPWLVLVNTGPSKVVSSNRPIVPCWFCRWPAWAGKK
jgi:hypothetical protein